MMVEYSNIAADYIERLANRAPNQADGDYEEDGVLICGNCRQPKQAWVDWIPDENGVSEKRLVPVMCRCEQEKYDAEREQIRREQFAMSLAAARESFGLSVKGSEAIRFSQDDAPGSPISRTCRRYVEKWEEMRKANIGILFYGSKGTGKTFYAACIANELAEQMVSSVVVTTAALIGAAQGKTERAAIIAHLNRFALLILDDLGAERDTSYGAEVIYSVIDARYRAGKPLIVTTNLDEDEMKSDADPMRSRVYDRVREMCAVPLKMLGESRRSGIAEERRKLAREVLLGVRSDGL